MSSAANFGRSGNGSPVMEQWTPKAVEPGECLHWQIGPLKLWIRRVGDEVQIATDRLPEDEDTLTVAEPSADAEGEDRTWKRWAVAARHKDIQLLPVMPDRPVIARPESDFVIPAGEEALFFVNLPVWVRVTAGEKRSVTLCEIPSIKLSKSWFGDEISGQLCYALHTLARRSLEDVPLRPHRAVCPIRNVAREQLEFERLCLHVDHLKIFRGRDRLWTNQVTVTYRGEDQLTQIDFSTGPPTMGGPKELFSDARVPRDQGLLGRTFAGLRALGGF